MATAGMATYGTTPDHQENANAAAPDRRRRMSDTPPARRTFDREEVALILREAAQLDEQAAAAAPSPAPLDVGADGLTLAEIEHAAAEVGIARAAVAAASLSVALRTAHVSDGRFHAVHALAGELTSDDLDRLTSEIRTLTSPLHLTRTSHGLDFEIGKPNGAPGSLRVELRTRDRETTIEVWSHAPAMTTLDLASCGVLGVPAALFPIVGVSGGAWPGLGAALALGTAGAVVGTGIGAGVQRWRLDRWRKQLASVVLPVAAHVSELVRKLRP
ncbi:MAG: hypothetical protein ABIP93_07735 [Gemmatimonadaceae bacterium]